MRNYTVNMRAGSPRNSAGEGLPIGKSKLEKESEKAPSPHSRTPAPQGWRRAMRIATVYCGHRDVFVS